MMFSIVSSIFAFLNSCIVSETICLTPRNELMLPEIVFLLKRGCSLKTDSLTSLVVNSPLGAPFVNSNIARQVVCHLNVSSDSCSVSWMFGTPLFSPPSLVSILTIVSLDSVWNSETSTQLTSILYELRRNWQTFNILSDILPATINKRKPRFKGGISAVSFVRSTSLKARGFGKCFPRESILIVKIVFSYLMNPRF